MGTITLHCHCIGTAMNASSCYHIRGNSEPLVIRYMQVELLGDRIDISIALRSGTTMDEPLTTVQYDS